jgi:hypothetical protein
MFLKNLMLKIPNFLARFLQFSVLNHLLSRGARQYQAIPLVFCIRLNLMMLLMIIIYDDKSEKLISELVHTKTDFSTCV